jgi:hypothetical protein
MLRIDARLPVRFAPLHTRRPDEAVLTDGAAAPAPSARFMPAGGAHGAGCACCVPRSGAATALATLFRERAVGGPAFAGVLAVVGAAGEAAVRAALAADPLVSARFREAGGQPSGMSESPRPSGRCM